MNLNLNNFGKIQKGSINLNGIAFVSSSNSQGKTTITRSLEFLSQDMPKGFIKKDVSMFINDEVTGQKRTAIDLDNGNGRINVKLPSLDKTIEGDIDFNVDEFSLNSLVMDLPKKDKFSYFQKLLKLLPTDDELKEKLTSELKDYQKEIKNDLENIIKTVNANGYDSAGSFYKEKKSAQRNSFEYITGSKYGKSKSPNWQPKHWSLSLDNTSKKALEEAKVSAQREYDDANGAEAVDVNEYNRKTEIANNFEKFDTALQGLKKDLEEQEKVKSELTPVDKPKTLEQPKLGVCCPYCQKNLMIDGNKIIKFNGESELSEEDKTEQLKTYADMEKAYKEYRKELKDVDEKINILYGRIATGEERVRECLEARDFIKENEVEESKFSQSEIDKASENLETAIQDLKAFNDKKEADKFCRMITYYDTIMSILSADGIRKETAKKGIGKINKILEKFPDDIECHEDFSMTLDGRDYRILSKSDQWRVDHSLKIINALLKKHSLVVLDAFDILVKENKIKWMKLLNKIKLNILVLSSENEPVKTKNSYVIKNGEIKKI